ncbi:MAG TPA: flagellar hook-length control protein FliK [Thermodesulfovibrionales bacterium]|nr:flagellar hook-length control protein FliK [Thermodesulfovibrionales bacterium]
MKFSLPVQTETPIKNVLTSKVVTAGGSHTAGLFALLLNGSILKAHESSGDIPVQQNPEENEGGSNNTVDQPADGPAAVLLQNTLIAAVKGASIPSLPEETRTAAESKTDKDSSPSIPESKKSMPAGSPRVGRTVGRILSEALKKLTHLSKPDAQKGSGGLGKPVTVPVSGKDSDESDETNHPAVEKEATEGVYPMFLSMHHIEGKDSKEGLVLVSMSASPVDPTNTRVQDNTLQGTKKDGRESVDTRTANPSVFIPADDLSEGAVKNEKKDTVSDFSKELPKVKVGETPRMEDVNGTMPKGGIKEDVPRQEHVESLLIKKASEHVPEKTAAQQGVERTAGDPDKSVSDGVRPTVTKEGLPAFTYTDETHEKTESKDGPQVKSGHPQGENTRTAEAFSVNDHPKNGAISTDAVHQKSEASDVLRTFKEPVIIAKKNDNSIEVTVKPDGVGKIQIHLSLDKGIVHAKVDASEVAGKDFIDRNIHNILSTLSDEGINIGSFSVHLGERRDERADSRGFAKTDRTAPEPQIIPVSAPGDNCINIFV